MIGEIPLLQPSLFAVRKRVWHSQTATTAVRRYSQQRPSYVAGRICFARDDRHARALPMAYVIYNEAPPDCSYSMQGSHSG